MEININEFLKTPEASVMAEDSKILYDLIIQNKPASIFEIGSGTSTLAMLIAVRDLTSTASLNYKNEVFVSVDIDDHRIGELKEEIKKYNLSGVELLNLNSINYLFGCQPKCFDFIFIDSSHLFEQTITEIALCVPLLRDNNSFLVLHDTKMSSVINAVYSILKLNDKLDFYEFNTEKGLGVLKYKNENIQ